MRTPKVAGPGSADTPLANTYPIRAVSLMTGVGIDTLRAWERRYSAVTPQRDGRGRVYSDEDVRRIRLLHDAVNKGYAIGRVASYTIAELERLPGPATRRDTSPAVMSQPVNAGTPSTAGAAGVAGLLAATESFDAVAVEAALARAAALLSAPQLLRDLIVPALNEVGARWQDGAARIAHEHLLSASVRNVLGSLLRLYQKTSGAETLLFATPAGEAHELGALGAAVLAASFGLGTIYLGPSTPADEVLATLRAVSVRVVVLGVVGAGDLLHTEAEVRKLAAHLPADTELWLGGSASERLCRELGPRVVSVPTYEALELRLRERAAQPRREV